MNECACNKKIEYGFGTLYTSPYLLAAYSNQELVTFFLQGLTEGFRISCDCIFKPNMNSVLFHSAIVEEYILSHTLFRMAGAFPYHSIHRGQVRRFEVIAKHYLIDPWQLIVDLSHTPGFSINDGI